MSQNGINEGDVLRVKCAGCRRWFEWVAPSAWWGSVSHYHSKGCRDKARMRRLQAQEAGNFLCPTPHKRVWKTEIEANRESIKQSRGQGLLYQTYRCVCGGLHVGHLPHKVVRRAKSRVG